MKSIYERELAWSAKHCRMENTRREIMSICCNRYGECDKCVLRNAEYDPKKMNGLMRCKAHSMTLERFYAFITKKEASR